MEAANPAEHSRQILEPLQHAVDEAARLLRADGAIAYLLEADGETLRWAVDAGISAAANRGWMRSLAVPVGTGMFGRSVAERTVRVRHAGDRAFVTVKGRNTGPTRSEWEWEIPVDDAEAMLAICDGPIIDKTRHLIEYAGRTWEVDVFAGTNTGLVMAEIELEAEDAQVSLPPWAGREVTIALTVTAPLVPAGKPDVAGWVHAEVSLQALRQARSEAGARASRDPAEPFGAVELTALGTKVDS